MASSKTPLKALSSNHHLPQLIAVAEKILPAKCKPQTLAYCPTMDLIALAADDKQLHVFRLNGQRVFGGSFAGEEYLDEGAGGGEGEEKEEKDVMRAVKWKNDGRDFFLTSELLAPSSTVWFIWFLALQFTSVLTALPS